MHYTYMHVSSIDSPPSPLSPRSSLTPSYCVQEMRGANKCVVWCGMFVCVCVLLFENRFPWPLHTPSPCLIASY